MANLRSFIYKQRYYISMAKQRIVIDARELRTGTGRYVERLLYYLQKIDNDNEYKVLVKPVDAPGWEVSSQNFKKVICKYKEFSFGEQLGFYRLLNKLKPSLVHFPMAQQPILYRGQTVTTMNDLTTLRYKNPSKNPVVFALKQSIYKWVNLRVAKKSSAVITYSQFVKDDIVKFAKINQEKIFVINLAADKISVPAEPIKNLSGKQFLVYVGQSMSHKNLERLIQAFGFIQAQHHDLVLVLAGKKDANYRRLEKHVEKKGITNVLFTDFVSEGQLRWLYENCEAYVFPSLSEGFGLPGLEAMLHGAPVISSSATCLPEIYGEAAQYFDPLNVQSMANAINTVLINRFLRTELIAKGKDQVAKYSWERTAEQTLGVYAKLIH